MVTCPPIYSAFIYHDIYIQKQSSMSVAESAVPKTIF